MKYQEIKEKGEGETPESLQQATERLLSENEVLAAELERQQKLLQKTQMQVQSGIQSNPRWLEILLGIGSKVVDAVADSAAQAISKAAVKVGARLFSKCSVM